MKKHILLCLMMPLLCFPMELYAQKKKASLPPPKKIISVEGITEYELHNGLKVLLFPDPSRSTITVNITYLVGSRHEGYGESGMAHLLEHLVFKGTPRHPNIPQELTARGARPNGTTWYDRTNYFETFNATEDNLRWALDMEADRMVNSFISKKDLESEFSVVRNEFEAGENDPAGILMERVISTAYLWHNYGKSTIGSKEDIERVPIENLQAFYRKYYQPDNAVLIVAGKIDEQKTLAMVNEYFGVIPRPTRTLPQTYTVEPVQDGERHVTLRRVGDVQLTAAGYHIPDGSHADFPAIQVLTDVLINEPAGRLYQALVETKKASRVYGFAWSLKEPGYAYFAAEVLKEKSLDDATRTFLNVFDNLKNNPVTREETERAKNKFLKQFEQTYNNSERLALTLSEYIAKGDWRLWFYYRDQMEKVTADDVNRVIRDYFKPSNRTTGFFIPESMPDRALIPPATDLAALLKDYKGRQAPQQAEEFDPSPSNIMARTKTGEITGGTRYALLPKSTRGNMVHMNMTLRLGNETALHNKAMVAQLTATMLRRGTRSKTYKEINDALDSLKSSLNISGSGQTVNVSLQSTKDNLIPALKILHEILRHPVFPAEELEKLRNEELADIEQQRSEPQAIASVTYSRLTNPYPKNHIRYTMDFDEQVTAVRAVTIEEVKKFYSDFYNARHATVAVIGAFDESAVLSELNNMLAHWTSPVTYQRIPVVYFKPRAEAKKINTPDKANAMMRAGFNLELKDDDPDLAALTIGNYMLGGGFLNSRLAVRIRQKEGISYGVGSFLSADPFDKAGFFGAFAIYNPDNSERLIDAFKDELDKMLKDGFKEEELKDAVNGWLQSRQVSRSQDRELVARLNNYLFLNRTLQWDVDLENKVRNLTTAAVNEAMRKWIKPELMTIIQAGEFERKKP